MEPPERSVSPWPSSGCLGAAPKARRAKRCDVLKRRGEAPRRSCTCAWSCATLLPGATCRLPATLATSTAPCTRHPAQVPFSWKIDPNEKAHPGPGRAPARRATGRRGTAPPGRGRAAPSRGAGRPGARRRSRGSTCAAATGRRSSRRRPPACSKPPGAWRARATSAAGATRPPAAPRRPAPPSTPRAARRPGARLRFGVHATDQVIQTAHPTRP